MKRKTVDWEAVERDYRAGVLTNSQIAGIYGTSSDSVRMRASRNKWKKDLTDQVRREAQAQLTRSDVCSLRDREIIAEGAAVRVAVVLRHRESISRLDRLKEKLAEKAEMILDGVRDGFALKEAVQSIEGLARTTDKLIAMERKAFNLDDEPTPEEGKEAPSLRVVFVGSDTADDGDTSPESVPGAI